MIPADIPLTPVQAGNTGSDRREAGGEAWRSAWEKEMERLQASQWFGHGIVGAPASTEEPSGPPPAMATAPLGVQGVRAPTAVLAQLAPADSRETVDTRAPSRRQDNATDEFAEQAAEVEVHLSTGASANLSVMANPDVGVAGLPAQAAGAVQTPAHAPAIDALLNHLVAALPGLSPRPNGGVPAQDMALAPPRVALPAALAIAPSSIAASANATVSQPAGALPYKSDVAAHQPAVERQGVRVHAEWTAQGVRLWLGMDADAAVPPAMLLQQLQRSVAALGLRLLSLTCNGKLVPLNESSQSTPATETEGLPWQSTQ